MMRTHKACLVNAFALLSLLAVSGTALAAPLSRSYQGTRPLGMGGAFTAVADDANALVYNPAGLNKLKSWSFAVINPAVEVGEDTRDFYDEAKDVDFENTDEVADLLRDHMGEFLHARVSLFPHFVMPNFGVGLIGNASADAAPHNVAFPEAEVDARGIAGIQVGGAMPVIEDRLRLGGAVKFMRGWKLDQTYTVVDIADENFDQRVKDDLGKGSGFGLDLGGIYTFDGVLLKPSVGVALQNVFDTDMSEGGELPMQLNVGIAATEEFWGWLTVNAAADWVDVFGNLSESGEDYDLAKRLHAGLEAWLTRRLGLRAGLYQGNPTFGATVDLWVLKAEYATYAEEIGTKAGARDDRRHVVQVSLGW